MNGFGCRKGPARGRGALFRRIIVGTDLTPISVPAIDGAVILAKRDEAELLIADVYQPPNVAQAEAVGPGVYEEWDENVRRAVERELQPLIFRARRQLVRSSASRTGRQSW